MFSKKEREKGKEKKGSQKSEVRSLEPLVRRLTRNLQPATRNSMAYGLMIGAFLLLFTLNISAQKKSETVVTIGDVKVSSEEFEANYRKNNTNILDKKDIKSPEGYLDLYIKFKLKVLEAQKLGYDTVRSYREELGGYRKELAKP